MKFRFLLFGVILLTSGLFAQRLLVLGGASINFTDLPITVTNHTSFIRSQESVTAGVPLPLAATQSTFSLFDGSQEIPVQTTILPDTSTPWLLLDFRASVPANQSKTYTLRAQSPQASGQAVAVVDDGQRYSITTGPLQVWVSKNDYNLFEEVWFDQNNNQQYESNEKLTLDGGLASLTVTPAGSTMTSGRNRVTSMAWEVTGPLRRTLRVEGYYGFSPNSIIDYTTRLTFYAGQSYVKIEHALRNSLAAQERYVKLLSAKINVGTATTTKRLARPGEEIWVNARVGQPASVELIPAQLTISSEYGPDENPPIPRTNTTLDVDANGGMVIGDLSAHTATLHVDFATGMNSSAQAEATAKRLDPLMALAPQSWYSDVHAFGDERFSTYDDEKAANQKWGWTWPTQGNPLSQEHDLSRPINYYPSWSVVDSANDPESDDLLSNIIMYARTGKIFFWDRARGWARYVQSEWAFRTDGFQYNGSWGGYWDGPTQDNRTPAIQPSLTTADSQYIHHNIKYGKASGSHMWVGGLIDFYHLTGNRDALEAAIDTAEVCDQMTSWQTPGTSGATVGGNARFQGRCLLIFLRVWEATGDQYWRDAADHLVQIFLQSQTYDPRGFYFGRMADLGSGYTARFPGTNVKYFSPFMMTVVAESLNRYYYHFPNEQVKTVILQMANFGRDNGVDPSTGYGGDYVVADSPTVGQIRHVSYSVFRNTTPLIVYNVASSTQAFIKPMIYAYRFTGDVSYLHQAKYLWAQGSKRNYIDPYSQVFATATQVGKFAMSLQGGNASALLFPEGGDWINVSNLFYEAVRHDTSPPNAVSDLWAR